MRQSNQIASTIFKQIMSNTDFIVFAPPSNVNNMLIVTDSIFPANVSGFPFLIVQTSDGGAFETTNYVSGEYFIQSNSNGWANTPLTTGLQLSCQYGSLLQYSSASFYVTDLNTSNKTNSYGKGMTFNGAGTTYMLEFVGRSPTSSTTKIKILMSDNSLIASGLITIYSLT